MNPNQNSDDVEWDYEGGTVECPYCDPDEMGWVPRPYLSSGSCHECGRTFELEINWNDDPDEEP